jgi:hypothetical protein
MFGEVEPDPDIEKAWATTRTRIWTPDVRIIDPRGRRRACNTSMDLLQVQ